LKVAVVHDWIVDIGGSEKTLKEILSIFPSADIFTLFYKKESLKELSINPDKVYSSFLQKFPRIDRIYRNLLPIFPFAIEQFDLSKYDLIISSSHAVAKGVLTNSKQIHISYCYTPIRYAWDLYHQYLKESNLNRGIKGLFAKSFLHYLRMWDVTTVNRVDEFIAISNYISRRIKKIYNRSSTVIYPPVDVEKFQLFEKKENFYLTVSRLVPYKRVDILIKAFSKMPDRKLIVIGDGPDLKKLKKLATRNIEFLGYQKFSVVKDYLQRAKAFLFAGEEDFGIVLVEAQACGTPVIAYNRGGASEIIINKKTGILFNEQSVESLIEAIREFERIENNFNFRLIRENSIRFRKDRFHNEFKNFLEKTKNSF